MTVQIFEIYFIDGYYLQLTLNCQVAYKFRPSCRTAVLRHMQYLKNITFYMFLGEYLTRTYNFSANIQVYF